MNTTGRRTERLLRVEAPHFVAGCVWVKTNDGWIVDPAQCAPIIKWMIERSPKYVDGIIKATGWRHEWL